MSIYFGKIHKSRKRDRGSQTLVKETPAKVKRPPLYKVVILNDDFTPMEFVVEVLRRFFHKPTNIAIELMLRVHHSGLGVCGVFPKDIAQTKAKQVLDYAAASRHPLQCVIDKN